MKMTREVFFYDDIPTEAGKEKARSWYKDSDDMPWLEEYVTEKIVEGLDKIGYSVDGVRVFYSLSYSQGDGVSFEGTVTYEKTGKAYTVKQSGRYCHEYTMSAYTEDYDGYEQDADDAFMDSIRSVAIDAKRAAYREMEAEREDESVAETIRANGYTFTADGERLNPDNA